MDDGKGKGRDVPEQMGIAKTPTGIEGFDAMARGGLPRRRTSLLVGGPGCGKTVFALQTLVNGATQWGEPGVFVAFEENAQQIVENAATFGWDLPSLQQEHLFFLDARVAPDLVASGDFDLGGLLAGLGAKVEELGARRVVFDSVDVLLALLNDRGAARRELYRLKEWLADKDLTGLVTAKLPFADAPGESDEGFLHYMADCVIELQHQVEDHVSLRRIRVVKYRGSSFAENGGPMVIGPSGIAVGGLDRDERAALAGVERIATGVERLDTMLAGGYLRGSSVLISGAPGTAKSTLCMRFADAACRRGERVLYFGFDETASETLRNAASVGTRLQPHLDAGLLVLQGRQAEMRSAEEHYLELETLARAHEPHCLVVDPLSALIKTGGPLVAREVGRRVLNLAKQRGITLVCTSLLQDPDQQLEATDLQVSTMADTWLHLSYVINGGERNRALSVVKARGTAHSNQVRELLLTDQGVTLAPVYTAGGEVLMGTLRWEQQQANARERERARRETERQRIELELAAAQTQAQVEALGHELELRRAELAQLTAAQAERESEWAAHEEQVARLRSGDGNPAFDGRAGARS